MTDSLPCESVLRKTVEQIISNMVSRLLRQLVGQTVAVIRLLIIIPRPAGFDSPEPRAACPTNTWSGTPAPPSCQA